MAEAETSCRSKHLVVISRSCLDVGKKPSLEDSLISSINSLKQLGYPVVAISHDVAKLGDQVQRMDLQIDCIKRGTEIRNLIKEKSQSGHVIIIVGAVNEDLHLAASTKSFLIGGGWVDQEEKVTQYGVPVSSPEAMENVIKIIANQTDWYYSLAPDISVPDISVSTKIVALCRANTYGRSENPNEKEMAEKIQAVLKDGDKNPSIKKALMCHLMAAIAHDPDFKEVQDWACAPSSTGANEVMKEIKEHVRYMMNGRNPKPIFIRHTSSSKSRYDGNTRTEDNYCQKHFTTINVNQVYREKLKGRVVCVLDDYLTHGNTFEALRNLLVSCKVKKIIFVAIGKFLAYNEVSYKQQHFDISGNVYSETYEATVNSKQFHEIIIKEDAKRSLGELKTLAELLEAYDF